MLHLLKAFYRNPEEANINYPIINREYEKELSDYIVACFRSISLVLNEIELVEYKFIIDTDKVNQGSYERVRSNKQKDLQKQFCYINESRLGELIMKFHVDMEFEGEHTPLLYKVKLLIPIADEKGYHLIKGNRYILQYQLTESSTYTTSNSVIQKSLMPIKIRKNKVTTKTFTGEDLTLNMYEVLVFKKFENYLIFYLATMGWSNTLEYFSVGKYIHALPEMDNDTNGNIYIKVSSGLYLRVSERALLNDYVQAMLGNIVALCNNRLTYQDLEDKDMWINKIGALKQNSVKDSHYEMGKRSIILFNRMLDESTIENLTLQDYNRRDVYAIIRWVVQNFQELWEKDNLNIINKRLRCNECVASSLNDIISERIKKFVNTTANTKDKQKTKYDHFFAYRGNEVVTKLHQSGLMRFDDMVNDADLFQRLKVTSKGPSGSGNTNDSKTVSGSRRGLDPSHEGRLDINFCSSSDPGLTNYLSLGCKTNGMYFENAPEEPESFYYNFKKEMGELDDETGGPIVIIDPKKYNLLLDEISNVSIRRKTIDPSSIENTIQTIR